ncbi:hypothetical protein MTO96_001312 [Rhipicephalus appendiculatus]
MPSTSTAQPSTDSPSDDAAGNSDTAELDADTQQETSAGASSAGDDDGLPHHFDAADAVSESGDGIGDSLADAQSLFLDAHSETACSSEDSDCADEAESVSASEPVPHFDDTELLARCIRDFGQKTLPCSSTTLAEAILLIMSFVVAHGLTWSAVDDLLKLVNALLGHQQSGLPRSKYLFRKLWAPKIDKIVQQHYYCEVCMSLLEICPNQSLSCSLSINELPQPHRNANTFLAGLWFGRKHPDMALFMGKFVTAVQEIGEIVWQHGVIDLVSKAYLACVCVDAPARAAVGNQTQFNGLFGCPWCLACGTLEDGRRLYINPDMPAPERTTGGVRRDMKLAVELQTPVNGLKGPSAFWPLQYLDLVECFTAEYMHCVLLGVTRQFTDYWFDSSRSHENFYIGRPSTLTFLNRRLKSIQPPHHITRLPRSIQERHFWKAHEWRNWLLFYCLPCCRSTLPSSFRKHFALLSEAIFLLLQEQLSSPAITQADNLLRRFVRRAAALYGERCMTFNVHQLLHLARAARSFGPLWGHSAFGFENGNGQIVKLVTAANDMRTLAGRLFSLVLGILTVACIALLLVGVWNVLFWPPETWTGPLRARVLVREYQVNQSTIVAGSVADNLVEEARSAWSVISDCQRGNVDTAFLFLSAPGAWQNRAALRNTLLSEWSREFFKWTGVFLIGLEDTGDPEGATDAWTDLEAAVIGDIFRLNRSDDYVALTAKFLAGLRWVTVHCPRLHYVVKADDDVAVEPVLFRHYLDGHVGLTRRMIHCSNQHHNRVLRHRFLPPRREHSLQDGDSRWVQTARVAKYIALRVPREVAKYP